MLLHIALFVLGLGILYLGADWLVQGSSSVAIRFGIPPLIVGLTIVALGTSMPEFLLNFFAVFIGEDALAVGNIVGSNISNIAFILGFSAVLMPLAVGQKAMRREYPMMLVATLLFWGLASDGIVSRSDGVILVAGLFAFMAYLVRSAKRERARTKAARDAGEATGNVPYDPLHSDDPESYVGRFLHWITGGSTHWIRLILLLSGVVGLAIGARLMVYSAVEIAHTLNINPVIIGLTVVAIGTSLPEFAASMVCAFKEESDMSVGNILGSNMLNILFVVGTVALIRPMAVETSSLNTHFPVMIGFSLLLYPVVRSGYQISRVGGGFLLASFVGYLIWVILPVI